jgi:hypothetical protein
VGCELLGDAAALGLRAGKVPNVVGEQTTSSKEKVMWFQSMFDYWKSRGSRSPKQMNG